MTGYKHFRFWCQSVLPLVYDDSLSYYEVLCKVVDYINNMLNDDNSLVDDVEELKAEMTEIQDKIEHFDTEYLEKFVEEKIATMIFVEITDDGHIVYYIPDSWDEITFNTTELDIFIEDVPEYGRLVLSY